MGEREIIKINKGLIKNKHFNRGEESMFVGYSPRHPDGTHRFIKVSNKQVVVTRNFVWME